MGMLFTLFSAFFVFHFATAEITGTSSVLMPLESSAFRKNHNTLTIQNSQYVSYGRAYYRPGAADSNLSLALRLDDEFRWRNMSFHLAGKNELSVTENWNYGDVYDAHAEIKLGDFALAVGRKLDRWSEWENEWRQGVFQPRYLENKLRPEFAGLTGVFASRDLGPVKLTVGYMPVFIPDFAAHFWVENDKFVSRNPWFLPPASTFSFQNVAGDLRYSVKTQKTEKIVLNGGGIAKVEFAHEDDYLARLSFAYKPAQQLLLGFPSRNQFQIRANEDFMSIEITPRVFYQRVVSADQVVRLESWTLSASAIYENPQDDIPKDFTAGSVAPAMIYGVSLSRPLEADGPNAARVNLSAMKVEGGDKPDRGDFAQGEGKTLFERRYQYYEAYSLGLSKPWRGFGRFPLEMGTKFIYDRLQNGGVFSFNCGMNFSKAFRADLQVDYLGLLTGPAKIPDGFLADYRANDRIGIGMSYVY